MCPQIKQPADTPLALWPLHVGVSYCHKAPKWNSESPHLERGGSLDHIPTVTPDCPQKHSIYVRIESRHIYLSSCPGLSVFKHVSQSELSYRGVPRDGGWTLSGVFSDRCIGVCVAIWTCQESNNVWIGNEFLSIEIFYSRLCFLQLSCTSC